MNNHSDISKQPKQGRILLSFACGLILILLIGLLLPYVWRSESRDARHFHDVLQLSAIAIGVVGLVVLLFSYLFRNLARRMFRRALLPRYVFALACFATLIAAFYAVENWRGKRAWEKAQRQLEAKGAVLDWAAYIPAPVPDDQNFYKAPNMSEWFVKPLLGSSPTNQLILSRRLAHSHEEFRVLAHVTVIPTAAPLPLTGVDVVLKFDDSKRLAATDPQAPRLLRDRIFTRRNRTELIKEMEEITPNLSAPQNFTLVRQFPKQFQPVRIYLHADRMPTVNELGDFLSMQGGGLLKIESSGTNAFRVSSGQLPYFPIIAAEDYLKWSERFESELSSIREALRRPHARIDGDYERPFTHPIPNFVSIRAVAQVLAQRAQCYLLLNEPEKAWRELTLMHELRGVLGRKNQPLILINAMISVALAGMYESVIADGFRLQAWDEPRINAIANQLQDINLMDPLVLALKTEQAGVASILANSTGDQMSDLLSYGKKNTLWRKLKNPVWLSVKFAPRGWIHQNIASMLNLPQLYIEGISQDAESSMPSRIKAAQSAINTELENPTPYNFIALIAVPNFTRAAETAARNQTIARQGLIVCALEMYRLAQNAYPETLDALVPQYLKEIPKEIINGQSLKYRRTDDGKFLLYSVGWDEKDDGGVTSTKANEPTDWVWGSGI